MYENRGIKLQDNEKLYKITDDGEMNEVKKKVNNIPKGKELFTPDKYFTKNYIKAWNYLLDNLTAIELKIALKMSVMAEYNTNSLIPLDNKTTMRDLAEFFNIGINTVKKAFHNLFKQGVYASFNYYHYLRGDVEEWIFNPYISFKGRLVDSDIKELFNDTKVAKAFFN
jgi:hypothetical protein